MSKKDKEQNSGVRNQESGDGKKDKTSPKASPSTEKEAPKQVDPEETEKKTPEQVDPEETEKEAPKQVDPEVTEKEAPEQVDTEETEDEWGVKKKDHADVLKAFKSFVGLKVEDIMEVRVDPPHHPGKIVFLKHSGPNQKLIWDRSVS